MYCAHAPACLWSALRGAGGSPAWRGGHLALGVVCSFEQRWLRSAAVAAGAGRRRTSAPSKGAPARRAGARAVVQSAGADGFGGGALKLNLVLDVRLGGAGDAWRVMSSVWGGLGGVGVGKAVLGYGGSVIPLPSADCFSGKPLICSPRLKD